MDQVIRVLPAQRDEVAIQHAEREQREQVIRAFDLSDYLRRYEHRERLRLAKKQRHAMGS